VSALFVSIVIVAVVIAQAVAWGVE